MPTFQGQVNEEGLMSLIEYIKSLPSTAARRRPATKVRTMTTTVLPRVNYLNVRHGVASWLLTKDHKRIGIMYLVVVTIAFFLGGLFAAGIRIELTTPQGDFVSADTYNRLFTMHGVVMVFFVLIPVVPAVLGNFVLPLMIGAKDVAFPKINLLSWYVFVIGFIFTITAMVTGGVDTGWTFYTPYSSQRVEFERDVDGHRRLHHRLLVDPDRPEFHGDDPPDAGTRADLVPAAALRVGAVRDQPRQILATPVIAITIGMMALERALGFGIFDPRLGGDPVLFQHLFWFYSHPAVYIMILPPMGVISEVIACFSRKNVFGYSFVAFSSLAIAVFGFLVWAHHLFVAGISPYSAMVFSFLSFAVAIPSAVKVFNWTATLYQGAIWWRAPMMWVFGFIGLFLIGGLTGLFLASLGLDVHLHDTYFVVAHFHYIMVGGAIMGFFAGLHYWWPKMTGRMYLELGGHVGGAARVRRLQPDVLPAVHPRLPRHAAPLPRVPGRVPGAERAVVGRRVDSRRRLHADRLLPRVFARSRVRRQGRIRGSPPASSGRPSRRRYPRTSRRRRS